MFGLSNVVLHKYLQRVSLISCNNGHIFLGAARLMSKHSAHAATHVSGQGLLNSAINLARAQKNNVSFVVHNLPVMAKMAAVNKILNAGNMFGLAKVRLMLNLEYYDHHHCTMW